MEWHGVDDDPVEIEQQSERQSLKSILRTSGYCGPSGGPSGLD
jgi:hypothetical protein